MRASHLQRVPLASRVAFSAMLAATFAADGAVAGSQMFKCVEGGRTVYQQQACPVSQTVDAAASSPRTAVAAAAAEPASAAGRKLKRPSAAASSAL